MTTNIPTEEVVDLGPFRAMVMTIGTLPTAFTESMTYYEALAYFVRYLEETIIPAINQNAEATKELQKLFVELKDYVDNYFDNLDIQTEINNKLDEMAASGELEEIISAYLNSNAVMAYNTISDLAAAENIIDGSFAYTFGKLTYNDGEGAFYKIREIKNTDVVDGFYIVALIPDDLVAERMENATINSILTILSHTEINVKDHGVVGDGVTDDTTAIQALIDTYKKRVLYFPTGTYLISSPLTITDSPEEMVDFRCETNAYFKTEENIDCLLEVCSESVSSVNFRKLKRHFIRGGTWDCTNCQYGIILDSASQFVCLEDNNIIMVSNTGLYLRKNADYISGDNLINNLCVSGVSSISQNEPTGVLVASYDNEFNNLRINGCTVGLHITGAGTIINNYHALYIGDDNPNSTNYQKTIACLIDSPNVTFNKFHGFYCDSLCTGIKVSNASLLYVTDGYMNSYLNTSYIEGSHTQMFWFVNSEAQAMLTNCRFDPTDGNITAHNIRFSNTIGNSISRNKYRFINCNWNVKSYMPANDLSFGMKSNSIRSMTYTYPYTHTMTANKYYRIGLIKTSQVATNFNLSMASDGLAAISIRWSGGSAATATMNKTVLETMTHSFKLALCDEFTDNNERYVYLCIMTTDNNVSLNAGFEGFNGGGNAELYAPFEKWGYDGYTPGTVLQEISL